MKNFKDTSQTSLHKTIAQDTSTAEGFAANLKYLLAGMAFGIVLVKAEIVSWFRIQEMFRFQSFHMFGVIGTAVVVGAISVFLIKKFRVRTFSGEPVHIQTKNLDKGTVIGGLIFGIGWAITGACPGPLFAQLGSGLWAAGLTLVSAIAGAYLYGAVEKKLPK